MEYYTELYLTYKQLYEKKKKLECLRLLGENGFCIPSTLVKTFNTNSQRKQKVLENYVKLKRLDFNRYFPEEVHYPEAECAVYDLSGRTKTKKKSLVDMICSLNYLVQPHNVYMYNLNGYKSGYNYYSGQKVIVYQITDEISDTEKTVICNAIKETTIKEYHTNDPLFFVYKVIIVTTKQWNSKYDWLYFDLGIDGDDFSTLLVDALNGKKHEWTFKDGTYVSHEERQELLKEKMEVEQSEPDELEDEPKLKPIRRVPRKKKQKKLTGFVEI